MTSRLPEVLPRIGAAGSRSAGLHGSDDAPASPPRPRALQQFLVLRWIGTMGALLMGVGGLGAGALPVINSPFRLAPGGDLMARMLQASSSIVLIGVAFIVLAWALMWRYVGESAVTTGALKRTFAAWALPIALTAPLFTQDIYSYLAQGSIVAQGLDPYEAGPVQLLGTEHHLARSVPFIWANSPSPYGPVALGIAAFISRVTQDSIVFGVLAHRGVNLAAIVLAGWAVSHMARRCGVRPATALWLGLLNPLTLLHLVGGIHNEAIMLGLALAGLEIGFRGIDRLTAGRAVPGYLMLSVSLFLISCAGMVKVTGFIGLGFVGMTYAHRLRLRGRPPALAVGQAIVVATVGLIASVALMTWVSGINLGWATGQGGAASIRSWMSITTDIGVIFGFIGEALGLGDHSEAMLIITRGAGLVVSLAFLVRMLLATFAGRIHPVGGLGVSTFVLVILFPVVHPWYMLWAILPLATWANRPFFRIAVVAYSTLMSFFVLPRGLALSAQTVLTIYLQGAVAAAIIGAGGWFLLRRLKVIA
ncbi:polyprenol phosphomannose-dependent alpha 1,6 mannosyltransferase MptB [Corynebacterium uterequi]|uniref:Carotene biosynthesis associated membrane protein n=1 Tax=Corynebacterium uterequi TaxID=1072256 RepID=A0A0G3HEL4_9CORY|nr:polyprenol phosphomannose-dependent alpha 1,6 mannosyltransferase MptB [Corynebacterium uterequi]AKK11150.1 hypothetical protein CUTER_05770 [Corynebacterium uterequi]